MEESFGLILAILSFGMMCTEALTLREELAEVAPKCLLGSLVVEKEKKESLESGAYVAERRKGRKEKERRRTKRGEKERSHRGGGCLHLIPGLSPSHGQVYSTAARPVLSSVLCNALSML